MHPTACHWARRARHDAMMRRGTWRKNNCPQFEDGPFRRQSKKHQIRITHFSVCPPSFLLASGPALKLGGGEGASPGSRGGGDLSPLETEAAFSFFAVSHAAAPSSSLLHERKESGHFSCLVNIENGMKTRRRNRGHSQACTLKRTAMLMAEKYIS